jgi:hypothetical protein
VLGGAICYRLLVTGGPIDERLAQGIVELILRGFAPRNTRAPAGANPKERRPDEDSRPSHRNRPCQGQLPSP